MANQETRELPPHLGAAASAIAEADRALEARYADRLQVNADLGRRVVSFQADKAATESRWFRYKEGFSAPLVRYALDATGVRGGSSETGRYRHLLEPFAGSGTSLFVAREAGMDATGIELLPCSAEIIAVRKAVRETEPEPLRAGLLAFAGTRAWERSGPEDPFPHLRITNGAFPLETERQIARYRHEITNQPEPLRRVLRFAALCVLEAVSYTRKDGQYLRWDQRSGRCLGKKAFDKGYIPDFSSAVVAKLREIATDLPQAASGPARPPLSLFDDAAPAPEPGAVCLREGSCLEILPTLETASFDAVVTSPPYANRYDYTRTYALELALLGADEEEVKRLRQTMLSCTVENREKSHLKDHYSPATWDAAARAFTVQEVLQITLAYLDACREAGVLNNAGIPRMIRGYFWEMCLLIFESARVLRSGSPFVMVNDNVRYQGVHIPVDLILSDFARAAGFAVERIWVLPTGKGNSSQQMGAHGRSEVRKCVYVWRKE